MISFMWFTCGNERLTYPWLPKPCVSQCDPGTGSKTQDLYVQYEGDGIGHLACCLQREHALVKGRRVPETDV